MKPLYIGGIILVILLIGAFFYVRPELLRPEPLPEAECTTDVDCAPAGCSGQVCTTAAKAPSIITTCEMREEYVCLKQTSCGCNAGKCSWKDTPEYRQCLEGFKKI
jgi:eight-cysteine-cluster-containing protein